MNARIRTIGGEVVVLKEFGAVLRDSISKEEKRFIEAVDTSLKNVPGGWVYGVELTTGRFYAIVAENISSITPVD